MLPAPIFEQRTLQLDETSISFNQDLTRWAGSCKSWPSYKGRALARRSADTKPSAVALDLGRQFPGAVAGLSTPVQTARRQTARRFAGPPAGQGDLNPRPSQDSGTEHGRLHSRAGYQGDSVSPPQLQADTAGRPGKLVPRTGDPDASDAQQYPTHCQTGSDPLACRPRRA